MNFLKRLLGIKPDPTAEWPESQAATPQFDLRSNQVGSIRLGSPLNEARVFGKPDEVTRPGSTNPDLLYARSGFSLDYEEGVLVFVTYYTGPDEFEPKHPALVHAKPRIIAMDGSAHDLHADTDAEALVAVFGKPGAADVDEDESILEWTIGEMTIEAGLNARGRLKQLNIFLTN